MKKEDKELLIKDISARIPYYLQVEVKDKIKFISIIYGIDIDGFCEVNDDLYSIDKIKPYLFPLSSMTEKQKIECFKGTDIELDEHNEIWSKWPTCSEDIILTNIKEWLKVINYFNVNHFDYEGLIEKGLAIDATNTNVYN